MRAWLLAGALAASVLAGAQTSPSPSEGLASELPSPQILINVREHSSTADMVTVILLRQDYPPELLQEQLAKLGQILGSEPRGLQILEQKIQSQRPQTYLRATFATDNIIDRSQGIYNLAAVVHCFLGAPKPHTLDSFLITLEGEKPNEKTLRTYKDDYVKLTASVVPAPLGLEYRIAVTVQDAGLVRIPVSPEAAKALPLKPAAAKSGLPDWALWLLILAGGAALGVLVYFAALRRPLRTEG